jgi:hypothetical protein
MAEERKTYIDNGENINPLWYGHLAISTDGVSWETISKEMLDVSARIISQNADAKFRNPAENKGSRARISLKRIGDPRPVFEFDIDNVGNQPTWLVGTLRNKISVVVEDITTWLGSMGGGGGDPSVPTILTSVKTTGAGNILPGSKAATIFIDGSGGSINGVIRPDGWSQSFEFHNDTLPRIDYDGNNTATMYVDILT